MTDSFNKMWNDFYSSKKDILIKNKKIVYDNWIDKYQVNSIKIDTAVLDLGCGLGNNTQ